MGDLVQALPCVRHLRKATSGRITWVVDVGLAELIRGNPEVDEIIEFPRNPYAPLTLPRSGFQVLTRLVNRLRRESFDVAIDLQGLSRSWFVLKLARAELKIARGNFPFSDHVVPHRRSVKRHASLACFESLKPLEIPVPTSLAALTCPLLGTRRLEGLKEPRVCLLPFTTWPSKHWKSAGWAAVADWLLERDYKVSVVGGHRDSSKVGIIRSQMSLGPQLRDLTGRVPLADLNYLFAGSLLSVGVDTGPLHVAWASGCPTISLYGGSDPARTAPWPQESHLAIRAPGCRSCCQRRCRQNCLARLPVETVIEGIESRLAGIETQSAPILGRAPGPCGREEEIVE